MKYLPSQPDMINEYDIAIHIAIRKRDFELYDMLIAEKNKLRITQEKYC